MNRRIRSLQEVASQQPNSSDAGRALDYHTSQNRVIADALAIVSQEEKETGVNSTSCGDKPDSMSDPEQTHQVRPSRLPESV